MSYSVSIKTPTMPAADTINTTTPPGQRSAKERAIAILQGNRGQEHPVSNPSKVSPEEMAALKTDPKPIETAPETGQPANEVNPPAEAPKVDTEAAKPKDEPLSAQYAQLARKEKALRAEAQRLKAEKEALEAERTASRTPPPPVFDPSKHLSRDAFQDPQKALETLAELGFDYSKLTEAQLNAPSPETMELRRTVRALETKLSQLEERQSGSDKKLEDQRSDSYQQAIKQITSEASKLVYSNDNFEMIKATNSTNDVVDLIKRTWDEENYLMSVDEACEKVESYLEEEALKLARLKKIQSKLQPAAATQDATAKKSADPEPKQNQTKTLTNAIGSTKQYSAKERAMLAAQYGPNWRSKVG